MTPKLAPTSFGEVELYTGYIQYKAKLQQHDVPIEGTVLPQLRHPEGGTIWRQQTTHARKCEYNETVIWIDTDCSVLIQQPNRDKTIGTY